MKKRTLPYGYEMRNGKLAENKAEAEIVRELFRAYADGASYRELTAKMESSGLPYSEDCTVWNKNMIARILNSELYAGTEDYPALIDRSLYDKAMARKPVFKETTDDTRKVKAVRELSRCAICGGEIRISTGSGKRWNRWNCAECGGLGPSAETEKIMELVGTLFRLMLQGDIGIIEPITEESDKPEMSKAEADFDDLLDRDDFDENAATNAAMRLAEIRYAEIGCEDYETMRIRYLLEQVPPSDEIDASLLKAITASILILPGGDVTIRLMNGQMIGGVKNG